MKTTLFKKKGKNIFQTALQDKEKKLYLTIII